MSKEWREGFSKEIQKANEARAVGNEGKARVCARRALRFVIEEYLYRKNIHPNITSAYALIQFLVEYGDVSNEIRETLQHFLIKVSPDGSFPVGVDLIADAWWIAHILLEDVDKNSK